MAEPALSTPQPSSRPRRSSTALSSYAETKQFNINQYSGTVDAAIEHFVREGGAQAAAARAVDCCPVALHRAINKMKEAGVWDDHMADIRAGAEPSGKKKPELDMPTPGALARQIKAGANRLGDGRPYGSKGNTWGEWREGTKIATAAIAAAGVTVPIAKRASARLAEAGVVIGKTTLYNGAKDAPGKTPVKMGDQSLKLPHSFIEAGRKVVLEHRELGLPNLKCMILAELNAMIKGTPTEALFKNGLITDDVYYNFLDRSDLYGNDTRPLEDDRALWRHSENARAQCIVWAKTFVDAKLGAFNSKFASPERYFEEAEPYEELIFWFPRAEYHVGSLDETDVAADETTRGRSVQQRSVLAAEPGSRRGHGAAGHGGAGGGAGTGRGWVESKKERKQKAPLDTGEVPGAKGGAKFTFAVANLGSGDTGSTLIVSKVAVETLAKKIDLVAVAPEATLVDPATGQKRRAQYIQTDSGGVETSTMPIILKDIFLPAFGRGDDEARLSRAPTVEDPDDVVCWDGLKQHHSLEWVRASRAKRVRTLLRYSHGCLAGLKPITHLSSSQLVSAQLSPAQPSPAQLSSAQLLTACCCCCELTR